MTNDLENSNWEPDSEKEFDADDIQLSNSKEQSLSDMIDIRLSRRTTIKGMAATYSHSSDRDFEDDRWSIFPEPPKRTSLRPVSI